MRNAVSGNQYKMRSYLPSEMRLPGISGVRGRFTKCINGTARTSGLIEMHCCVVNQALLSILPDENGDYCIREVSTLSLLPL